MRTPALLHRLAAGLGHHHGPQVRPVLPVRDLDQAQETHTALGLQVRRWGETYAWVLMDGHEILHLKVVADLDPATNHAEAYLFVNDVDDWHRRAAAAGLQPTRVRREPWGLREFALTDASGNRVRFGCGDD